MTGYVAGDRGAGRVPRTTAATGAEEVALAVSRRLGRPAALWGMLILIASEGTLFACFIATYYYLRFDTAVWPPPGIPEPPLVVPLVMLAVLVSTSLPMQLVSVAARAGRLARARLFLVVALVVQAGYLAYELKEFDDQLHRFDAGDRAYGSIYYTLLGADHAHVLLGILFGVWLLWKLASGLTTYRANAAQAIAWYWHAVNLITVAVVGTLLSARA